MSHFFWKSSFSNQGKSCNRFIRNNYHKLLFISLCTLYLVLAVKKKPLLLQYLHGYKQIKNCYHFTKIRIPSTVNTRLTNLAPSNALSCSSCHLALLQTAITISNNNNK